MKDLLTSTDSECVEEIVKERIRKLFIDMHHAGLIKIPIVVQVIDADDDVEIEE